jgi:L-glutamine-phosphate cytidylyltransferase
MGTSLHVTLAGISTMRPVLIGAGRGSRLEHRTDEIPKSLVEVMGRPMLDWILEALGEAGFVPRDIVFVCGYKADVLKARYPDFTYVENTDWENNNILESLVYARDYLGGGFVSSYTDIIYRGSCVKDVVAAPQDKVLVCDTDWRRRYVHRKNHPESDAEKMRAAGTRIVEVSRTIKSEDAAGEFIGVAKFTAHGAREFLEAYAEAKASCTTLGDRPFLKAYLIHLWQRMIEKGSEFHRVDTPGGYMELDTLEDLSMAETWWKGGS